MQENRDRDVIEIDLKDLFAILWAKAWLIIASAVVAGAAGFLLSSFVVTPKYESTTSIYILNKESAAGNITYSDAQLATQLTRDYENLIKGRTVLEQVMAEFTILDEDYEDFGNRIEVANPTDTRIITITVKDEDAGTAQQIADRIREVAALHIQSVTDVEAVNLVDYANLPLEPAEPSVPIWTVAGALIGALLCVVIMVIKYLTDDTIKTPDDIEKYLGLSTLALIPEFEGGSKKKKKRKKSGKK